MKKWSEARAWQWYNSRPWRMGFNYVAGGVRNSIEMWQEETFEQSLAIVDKELALAEKVGFNALRIFLPEFVWKHQHDSFMKNFEAFLVCCDRHGLSVMPVIFNDCLVPKRIAELAPPPHFGPQPDPDWGYHGGTKITPFDGNIEIGWWEGDDPATWEEKKAYLQDLISTYRTDERILMWDIWNEPGNNNRETLSLPLMERCFEWARELEPVQPLTACAWNFEGNYDTPPTFYDNPASISSIERRAIELSDIVTYHCYGCIQNVKFVNEQLKWFHRPLMNTEWLHRPLHNYVQDVLPYYAEEKVGSFHWGLVNGYAQFHEPWEFLRPKAEELGLDIDAWQHDIFNKDFTPYDEAEIALFEAYAPRKR